MFLHLMMEKNAFLQRRKRVDILYVGGSARYGIHHRIDLRLGERHQRQQVGRDGSTVRRNAVRRHHKGRFILMRQYRLCHVTEHRCGENTAYIKRQSCSAKLFNQADDHQRVAAEREEVVVAADARQSQ
ncbi:hypothetical protein PB72LOC_03349 [Pectobacterium atrosepticum]|nr:hypothetical protein PB72LOC_03349 [Pectobacterium atrosepticum]